MTYRLLDSGFGEKLEMLGDVRIRRQAAQAFWAPRRPSSEWNKADAVHVRSKKGGGHWTFPNQTPESWVISWGDLKFKTKLTPFGHIGLFPEQVENWIWLQQQIRKRKEPLDVLNLFAYTGGSTLACAQAGASVTHVDASKGVVSWARENSEINQLQEAPIRWIVDDVAKFIQRENRRARQYQALILDPPTYGRGAKGETWKIEEDLLPLLKDLNHLLPNLEILLLSCHSPGFSGMVLGQMAAQAFDLDLEEMNGGEMVTPTDEGHGLPSGFYCRWSRS